jgi:hypothetical protein
MDLTQQVEPRRLVVPPPRAVAEASASASKNSVAAGVVVTLRPADPRDCRSYQVQTDEEGRYVFQHIPAGRYRMTAWQPKSGGVICVNPYERPADTEISLTDQLDHTQDLVVIN